MKPLFTDGQAVTLVDDPQIWGRPFRGHTGVVEMVHLAVHLYEPSEWVYTVRIDDLPYSVQCGDYAIVAREPGEP